MRIKNFMGLVIFLLLISFQGGTIDLPAIPDGETRIYKVYYENLDASDASQRSLGRHVRLKESPRQIESSYYWKGQGKDRHLEFCRKEILDNGVRGDYQFFFKPGPRLVLDYFEKSLTLASGQRLRYEKYNVSHPIQGYPENLFHPFVLETAFRAMPLEPGYQGEVFIWAAPKTIVRNIIKVEKIETVPTDAGDYECYRMKMTPSLEEFVGEIASPVLGALLPDYTFWVSAATPHVLVKYKGPLEDINAITAPIQIYELVSITAGTGD